MGSRGGSRTKTVQISGSSLGASPLALWKGCAFPAEIAETLLFSAACRQRLHAAENRLYKKWRHRQGVAFPQRDRRSRRLYFIAGIVIWTTLVREPPLPFGFAGGADVPSFGISTLCRGRVHTERRLHREKERRNAGATRDLGLRNLNLPVSFPRKRESIFLQDCDA